MILSPMWISPTVPPSPVGKGAGGLGLPWRAIGILSLVTVVAVLALIRAGELTAVLGALRGADPRWLLLALLAQALPYLALTRIYASLFGQQGYPQPLGLLARVATVVLTINRVLPTMGVTSSVYLVTTLRRRKIPEGRILVVHTMEIVSYTVAFGMVTTWGVLVFVTRSAIEQVAILVPVVLAGMVAFFALRWLRRRGLRPMLVRWALAGNRVIGRLLPIRALRITEARVERFIDEVWHGVRLAATRPNWFVRAVLWQLASLGGDCLTIGFALAALGVSDPPKHDHHRLRGGDGALGALLPAGRRGLLRGGDGRHPRAARHPIRGGPRRDADLPRPHLLAAPRHLTRCSSPAGSACNPRCCERLHIHRVDEHDRADAETDEHLRVPMGFRPRL